MIINNETLNPKKPSLALRILTPISALSVLLVGLLSMGFALVMTVVISPLLVFWSWSLKRHVDKELERHNADTDNDNPSGEPTLAT